MRNLHPEQDKPARGIFSSFRLHLFLLSTLALFLSAIVVFAVYFGNHGELLRRIALYHLHGITKREVSIGKVRLNPAGTLQLIDVTISDKWQNEYPLLSSPKITIHFNPVQIAAFPGLPLKSVREVSLEKPLLLLTRNRQGIWNSQDLFEKKKVRKTGDRFSGEVVITDGEILFQDDYGLGQNKTPVKERLVGANGRFILGKDSYMPFRMSAAMTSQRVKTFAVEGAVRLKERHVECQVRYGGIDLNYVQKFMAKSLPISLQSGKADGRWQVEFDQVPNSPVWRSTMTVLADFSNVRGTMRVQNRNVPFLASSGQIKLADDVLELVGVKGEAMGVPLTVDGTVSQFKNAVVALQIHTEKADAKHITALIPELAHPQYSWSGQATGTVQLTGYPESLQVAGHVAGPSLQANFGNSHVQVTELACDLRFDGKTVGLSNVTGRSFGGEFSGKAWITVDSKQAAKSSTALLFQGIVNNAQTAEIARIISANSKAKGNNIAAKVNGTISGPVDMTIARDGKFSLISRATGKVSMPGMINGDVEAGIRVDIAEKQPARATIDRFRMRTAGGVVQGHGVIEDDRLDISLQGSGIHLHELAAQSTAIGNLEKQSGYLEGIGYMSAKVGGTFAKPIIEGKLRSQEGTFSGQKYAEFNSDFYFKNDPLPQITLENVRVLSESRELELSASNMTATVDAQAGATGQWHIDSAKLSRSRLSTLAAMAGLDLQIDGFVEGVVETADLPNNAGGLGKLELIRPSLHIGDGLVQFERATVNFTIQGQHKLEITNAQFEFAGLAEKKSFLTVTGWLSNDPALPRREQLSLRIVGQDLPVENIAALVGDNEKIGLLGPDGRIGLPFGVQGSISLDAKVTGQLADANGKALRKDLIARGIAISGSIAGGNDFAIAHVPYNHFTISSEYSGENRTLTLADLTLSPADGKRDYQLAAGPGEIKLSHPPSINLKLVLSSARSGQDGKLLPADLADLKQDLSIISRNSINNSYLATYLDPIKSISGKALCKIELHESLERPVISSVINITELALNAAKLPAVDADITYDTAPKLLTFNQFVARDVIDDSGGILAVDKGSTIVMQGPMNLTLEAHKIKVSRFDQWFPGQGLSEIGGTIDATISSINNSTTARPQFQASLDWFKPSLKGIEFDTINAIISLEDDPDNPSKQRLWIGQHWDEENGYATIPLKDTSLNSSSSPLELSGYLPLKWQGSSANPILLDEQFSLKLRIPNQSIDLVKNSLPKDILNKISISDAGTVEGCIYLGGTLNNMKFDRAGYLLAKLPQVGLPDDFIQTPNPLENVVLDLSLHSGHSAGREVENVIEVNRFSADGERPADDRSFFQRLGDNLKKAFGLVKKKPFVTPHLFAAGSIRFPLSIERVPSLRDLHYDLYARTSHLPLEVGRFGFKGNAVSFLRLQNQDEGAPRLSGVVIIDNSKVTYSRVSMSSLKPPHFAIDPELSLLIQAGAKNTIVFDPGRGVLKGLFPLKPTGIPLPDPVELADPSLFNNVNIEPSFTDQSPLYNIDADSITQQTDAQTAGSYGKITGKLSRAEIDFSYALVPRKSQVQLPGGLLTVRNATGNFHYLSGSDAKPVLTVDGRATGRLGDYEIGAEMKGNILSDEDGNNQPDDTGTARLPIVFNTISSPTGSVPLDNDQIYARLIGVPDFLQLLDSKSQLLSPFVVNAGRNIFLTDWFQLLGSSMSLESLSIQYDPSWSPELTLTTPEILKNNWAAVRMGFSRTFSEMPTWRTWLIYTVPNPKYRLLRDMSLTLELNEQNILKSNLQYQIPFSTNPKSPGSKETLNMPGTLSERFLISPYLSLPSSVETNDSNK